MATEHKEEVRVIRDEGFERRQRVVEHTPSTRRELVSRISQLVWLIVAAIVILLAFRFVLMLLAANPANAFASIIYNVTNVLVAPFMTLLPTPAFEGGSIVDVASLVAMVVYPLVAWLFLTLFRILFDDTSGFRRVKTVRRERLD
jgi:Fe2+ transport system protein B